MTRAATIIWHYHRVPGRRQPLPPVCETREWLLEAGRVPRSAPVDQHDGRQRSGGCVRRAKEDPIQGRAIAAAHYEAVVDRATVKLERLPLEFFRMLVHQFAGSIGLTVVADGDRVVAFNWGLLDGDVYRYLFCGLDYALARDVDLYFNLMYHQLDAALRRRVARIEMGQTADVFKARLGCRAVPRSVYVRGTRPLTRATVRWGSSLLFPRRAVAPTRAVFRYERASS